MNCLKFHDTMLYYKGMMLYVIDELGKNNHSGDSKRSVFEVYFIFVAKEKS